MKKRNIALLLFAGALFMVVTGFAYMQSDGFEQLRLTLQSEKEIYKFGEPIRFNFELTNQSKDKISLLDFFGTATGNLRIEISEEKGKGYVGFNNPLWGRTDFVAKTVLDSKKSIKADGKVLWYLLKQGDPAFMLTKSGDFFVKAKYDAWIEGNQKPINIESEPVKITLEEPVGEDLEVWNRIKGNGDFAYFISEGDIRIPSYKPEERAKFLNEVEQILIDYPNSFYAESLRQSLDKFRTLETRIQEIKDKQKPQ